MNNKQLTYCDILYAGANAISTKKRIYKSLLSTNGQTNILIKPIQFKIQYKQWKESILIKNVE